jgi:ribonuclease BN (tRNA processing enzyme)
MCERIGRAVDLAVPRRAILAGGSALVGSAAVPAVLGGVAEAAQPALGPQAGAAGRAEGFRTRLVLLGTAGGPSWWPDTARAGICSALVVNGSVYLVDCGDGAGRRLKQAALVEPELRSPGGLWGEETLRGMFVTHLHSDHVADYFNFFMLGWYNGITAARVGRPVQVFGPGRRVDEDGNAVMEPVLAVPGLPVPPVPVVNPQNPVPGITDTTNYLYQAFALDLNDRMRANLRPDLRAIFHVHDIPVPTGIGYHPDRNPSPPGMEPIPVYQDENVAVTATLVRHVPVAPAFGYRFDTADGAVVFSGDTAPSDNLARLARGADILVHEVIDPAWLDTLFPPPTTPAQDALKNSLLATHTTTGDVGKVAENAGVRTLVLSHIVPGNTPRAHLVRAGRDFSGRLIIGEDLMQIGVGRRQHH